MVKEKTMELAELPTIEAALRKCGFSEGYIQHHLLLEKSHSELLEALKLAVYKATFPPVESAETSTHKLLNEVIRKAELI